MMAVHPIQPPAAPGTASAVEPAAPGALQLRALVLQYGIPYRDLALAVRLNEHQVRQLANTGHWPLRCDAQRLAGAVREFLASQGVPAERLATALHAEQPREAGTGRWRAAPPAPPEEEAPVLLAKQTLSPAARKAFKLFANPFDGEVTSEAQMYCNADIAFVREVCHQTALNGRFTAIVGESGAGKSTVQADFEARIGRDSRQVVIFKPSVLGMDERALRGSSVRSTDILASILTTLDPGCRVPQQAEARSTLVQRMLADSAAAGFLHLLLIEEAHSMPDATLRHLKRLHEMRTGRRALLGILLLGQPELLGRLDTRRALLREVAQRCEVVVMPPLDEDVPAYLAHRASCAGRRLDEFVDGGGLAALRDRLTVKRADTTGRKVAISLAYPLAVNNMLTACLNAAADIGAPCVSADVVKAL